MRDVAERPVREVDELPDLSPLPPQIAAVPSAPAKPGPLFRPWGRLRDAAVAVASAGVLALLVFYAVAAPGVSLTTKVGVVVPRPGPAFVVGRVLTSSGGGLKGAHIEVRRAGLDAGTFGISNAAGAFRVELPGRCARYEISLRARAEGSTVASTVRRRLCPGDALPIDAHVVTQGHFLWIPGPR